MRRPARNSSPSRAAGGSSVAFSPDGKRLASASGDGEREGVGCADRPGTPLPQGAPDAGPAWPSARTASGWRVAVTRRHGSPVKSRCGMRRPARNSSPSRGTSPRSAAWSSARTANAWPARRRWTKRGEGVGCADRPGAPQPQSGRGDRIAVAFSPDGHWLVSDAGRHGDDLGRHAAAGEAVTARRTDAANRCDCRRRERPTLSAAALFSDNVSAGRWSVVRSRELIRLFRTPSNHTLSGRRPRVAFIVAPPCRADRSCRHAGLGAVGGGDGDRAPIERRPPLRVWERRIAGHARGTPPRIESSKDSDFLIGGASYRADR